ncbi:dolichyl-phosphate mannosyltransferase polypeptide 3 [Cordyceps militaris]|uniref:Dolichol-phosphate mannosyltransferase subunit 3 n=1 Tax=Cordyceps militaris TaxID=73501 RepID=A0A2H4S6Y5_CORMI|nr:dolichyl-phosphate mannosyltransferase polypeptide 3 [Cordyceps militaris]
MRPWFLNNALEPPYTFSLTRSLSPTFKSTRLHLSAPSHQLQSFPCTQHLPIMTRAQQTISFGLLVSSLYLALYLELVPLPALVQEQIVPVLPFWALVSFGALLLFRLGFGVFTFNNVPDAHKELMQEIDLAKVDLRKLGVDVD